VADFLSELDNHVRDMLNHKDDYKFNTAREILMSIKDNLTEEEQLDVFSKICGVAKQYAERIVKNIPVHVYLASYEGDIIAESK